MKNSYKNLPVHRAVGRNEFIKSGDTVFNPEYALSGELAVGLVGVPGFRASAYGWQAKRPIKWRKLRVGDRRRSGDYAHHPRYGSFVEVVGVGHPVTDGLDIYRWYDVTLRSIKVRKSPTLFP